MLEFQKIRYKNILSTGDAWTEIDLDKHNTTLIIGSNGAGKSTLLDALSFALYGKPFRTINKPQLINSINQKTLVVEVEFSVGGKEYRIKRGIKPNVFEVWCEGEMLNQDAKVSEYQEHLENEILKINHKSFGQIVVLGSSTFVPFMKLKTPERRAIIEDLLDIQVFSTMNVLLKGRVSENKDVINRLGYEIESKKREIRMAEESLEEITKLIGQQIANIKTKMNEVLKTIEDMTEEREVELQKAQSYIEKLTDTSDIEKSIQNAKDELRTLTVEKNNLTKTIKFFRDNDDCPTCEQKLDPDFKKKKTKETVSEREAVDTLYESKYATLQEAERKLEEIRKIQKNVDFHNDKAKQLKYNIDNKKEQLKSLSKDLEKAKEEKTGSIDQASIDKMKGELSQMKTDLNEALEQKKIYSVVSTLLKDGGIKSQIVKQYVPVINALVNKYLSAMEFFVDFNLDEEFNETIKSRYRDEFSYESFSEGEKMRINLALLFTWRAVSKMRNSMSTNILLMDEIFDSSLDSEGSDDLLEIFKELAEDSNIIVISHNRTGLQDKFDRVIQFDKHKNFSRMKILE